MKTTTISKITSICFALLAGVLVSDAQSGVWTNDTSSVWSGTTNWANGIVADGSGNTADFTMNNSNFDAVTLDSSRSLGTLLFGANAGHHDEQLDSKCERRKRSDPGWRNADDYRQQWIYHQYGGCDSAAGGNVRFDCGGWRHIGVGRHKQL